MNTSLPDVAIRASEIGQDLRRLWGHIDGRRRRQFSLLLALMIVVSFAEILSIGAVIPFLAVLTSPDKIFEHAIAQPFIRFLGITSADQLLAPFTIAFGLSALLAGAMRLLLLWASTHISFSIGSDLSLNIYRRTLYQPYAVHIARNSSAVIDGIVGKADTVTSVVVLLLNLVSSAVILAAVLVALILVDPLVALAAFGGFGLLYAIVGALTHKKLLLDSQRIARESTQVVKCLQEGLGGVRDVLLYGSQSTYCQTYHDSDLPLRRARGNNVFIGASPRYMMEALGMVLIAALAFALTQKAEGMTGAIPMLGALALGAQRLLPGLQQAYGAWSGIQGGRAPLRDALDLLDQPLPAFASNPPAKPIAFRDNIRLDDVYFSFAPDATPVLNEVNLVIAKGSRVGFIGVTGSGKSTLLDIVMGLLEPSKGHLRVDGQPITAENQRGWQAHIAHVAQDIFLSDSTIEENIAVGQPKDLIDRKRVMTAARQAQIADFIESLPLGYLTLAGERGVRLSGGQRQRIGIARALYRNADVIVFDEATSALDSETEQAVMGAIGALGPEITILIIAHRLSTLEKCTQIVNVEEFGGSSRSRLPTAAGGQPDLKPRV